MGGRRSIQFFFGLYFLLKEVNIFFAAIVNLLLQHLYKVHNLWMTKLGHTTLIYNCTLWANSENLSMSNGQIWISLNWIVRENCRGVYPYQHCSLPFKAKLFNSYSWIPTFLIYYIIVFFYEPNFSLYALYDYKYLN